jgi:hypothetical protein
MVKSPKPHTIIRQVHNTVVRHDFGPRLPKGERVTAILGFQCSDGVLLFADTEASYEVTKTECDKLRRIPIYNSATVLIGTAGTVVDADYASYRLSHLQISTPMSWENVESSLGTLAKDIYSECGPLEIDMLLAVRPWSLQKARMYRWCGNFVYPVESHTCCGSGAIHLDPQLRFLDFSGSSDQMLLYGIKLMLETKRLLQGVGGNTEAILLSHDRNTYKWYGSDTVREMENLVLEMERYTNRTIIPFIAGDAQSPEQITEASRAANEKLLEFRGRYGNLLGKVDLKPSGPQT